MNWLKIVHTVIVVFSSFSIYGQTLDSNRNDKIHMIAKVAKDKQSILLRWAPNNHIVWEYALKYGYILEKYMIMRGDSVLYPPVKLQVTQNLFKPHPPASWEKIIDTNDYAAIAAQAIYGETFEVTQNTSSYIVKIIQKVKESEQRFSFSLFSADQSFEVAQKSGLGYVDMKVEEDEKYLYRIYLNAPANIVEVDTGFFYIGPEDYMDLPQPEPPHVKYSNNTVLLSWEHYQLKEFYNSFIIEKSEDGEQTFKSISNKPFVTTANNKNRFYKMDSVPDNNQNYAYRIRGITPFGETGPPSNAVEVAMKMYVQKPAIINKSEVITNSSVSIGWEISDSVFHHLSKFSLLRSTKANDGFKILIGSIHLSKRKATDNDPYTTGYYKVRTHDKYGTYKDSFPVLVQLEDSIPPATPFGFTHAIDTAGHVEISWTPNEEMDFLGYHVYRANFRKQEFGRITNEPVSTPAFKDTINVRTLSGKVYYTITAVDKRYNESDYSQAIEIDRPDIIAPVPPVFNNISLKESAIELTWINSSSEDVRQHILYKRRSAEDWLFVVALTDTVFIDQNIEAGSEYQYTLIAVDEANLESKPARPVSMWVPERQHYPPIEEISYKLDREKKHISIHWKYDQPDVVKYYIYRKENDEPLSLYKEVAYMEYNDPNVSYNNNYTYRIKAIFKNGAHSPLSGKVNLKY